jgi:peroxiredoxin
MSRIANTLCTLIAAAGSALLLAAQPPPGFGPEVQRGTRAPDGIGVVMDRSPSAGPAQNGPWEPGSMGTPLQVGAQIPARSVVRDLDGKAFNLNAAVARQPTVLIFYRGGWCPYCNAHLRELQGSAPQLRKLGFQILAVSTDTPDKLRTTLEKNQLDYTLLSDAKAEIATLFGLQYQVVSGYLNHVKNDHKTDLVAQNGGLLLTPAAYLVDRSGRIRFAYVNNNFTVRVGQDKLLEAAGQMVATAAARPD